MRAAARRRGRPLVGEALAQLGEQSRLAGELAQEVVGLLPLVGIRIRLQRDQNRGACGNDPGGVGCGRAGGVRAPPAAGKSRRKEGEKRDQAAAHHSHSSHSWVGTRLISPATSSSSDVPSSTLQTPSVIGVSILSRCERSRSTGAVVRPSTTIPISRTASRIGPLRDQFPCAAVAARLRPARDDEVAHTGKPRERLGPAAGRFRETTHLREAARDQGSLGVVAEAETVRALRRARSRSWPRRRARRRRCPRSRRRGR